MVLGLGLRVYSICIGFRPGGFTESFDRMFFLLLTLCLSETGWVGLLLGWEGLVGWAGLGGWADLGLGWTLGWSSIIGELKVNLSCSGSLRTEVARPKNAKVNLWCYNTGSIVPKTGWRLSTPTEPVKPKPLMPKPLHPKPPNP